MKTRVTTVSTARTVVSAVTVHRTAITVMAPLIAAHMCPNTQARRVRVVK